jgi:hypothetical protein
MGAGGAFTGILRSAAFAAAGANINAATAESNNLRISIPHPGFVTEGHLLSGKPRVLSESRRFKCDSHVPVACTTQIITFFMH